MTTLGGLADTVGFLDLFTSLCLLLGFGVKVPVWPCFSWLLKAHVEASVEFSILLSGLIVKLGVWGLVRFLPFCEPQAVLLLAVAALLAMVEVTVRLWAQRDLKRVVALTTVFEMNWLVFCLCLGGPTFTAIAGLLAVAHSFTTTTEFFLVECVSRRFGTRDCTELQGLFSTTPLLALFTLLGVLVTIGFPGTSLFTLKLFFFTALCSFSLGVTLVLAVIFLVFLPLFFIRLWAPIWLGLAPAARAVYFDLTAREATLVGVALLGGFVLGWWPSLAYAI